MIFVDTNVVSEVMRPKPDPRVVEWLAVHADILALPAIVLTELNFGIAKVRPSERSTLWVKQIGNIRQRFASRIYAFDEALAMLCGEIMGQAALNGRTVALADGMIAATALQHGTAVATRNVRDFEALGAKVVNPWV